MPLPELAKKKARQVAGLFLCTVEQQSLQLPSRFATE